MRISIVWALPKRQMTFALEMPEGSTAGDALVRFRQLCGSDEVMSAKTVIGIYGQVVSLETKLSPDDRLEIYRPLLADPKEIRRKRTPKHRS